MVVMNGMIKYMEDDIVLFVVTLFQFYKTSLLLSYNKDQDNFKAKLETLAVFSWEEKDKRGMLVSLYISK